MWRVVNGDQEELEAIQVKPRESATENTPPMDSKESQARLKSCGKSARMSYSDVRLWKTLSGAR